MLRVNVRGGTAAGRRVVKQAESWHCPCAPRFFAKAIRSGAYMNALIAGRQHPGDRYSCPDCGARRP